MPTMFGIIILGLLFGWEMAIGFLMLCVIYNMARITCNVAND